MIGSYIQTGQVATHYQLEGSGSELVFVHGTTIDGRIWDPQWPSFCRRHRCLRYDRRGCGRSSAPASGYDAAQLAADLELLLDGVGMRRPALIGLSSGGMIGMELALRAPERVRALVLVDSALDGFDYSNEHRSAWRQFRAAVRSRGVAPALEEVWRTAPLFQPLRGQPQRFARIRELGRDYRAAEFLDRSPRPARPAMIERLGAIRCPTLVLVGERDSTDFQSIATLLARSITGARLARIAGAGHLSNFEQPERFNRLVLDFLSSL
jgi:3-oxoadipate enol-lactonase